MMRKSFNYDTIQIGEVLGRKQMLITDELIRTCANAIEASNPWYFDDSPLRGRIAPPTVFANVTLDVLDEQYERFGSIHVGQAWEFNHPVRLGQHVSLTVTVADKYRRRERPYIVMTLDAVDEAGVNLCRSIHTSLMTMTKEKQS